MAFSWLLGRLSKRDGEYGGNRASDEDEDLGTGGCIDLADVMLSIDEGLLMAFGPLGDPIAPDLLREACTRQPHIKPKLRNGFAVDHDRLIAVLDAQQRCRLADREGDRWISAMLGTEGRFEETSYQALEEETHHGRAGLTGQLALDMPGGETITLCDAYPGERRHAAPASLLVDGKPTSIEALLHLAGRSDLGGAVSKPAIMRRGKTVALRLGKDIEAVLEASPAIWDGLAKVDISLSNGRQVSIDELADLLQTGSARDSLPEMQVAVAKFPLIDRDEPVLKHRRATLALVDNVPEGWSITTGLQCGRGRWLVAASSLATAAVRIPGVPDYSTSLDISVISILDHQGRLEKHSHTVLIPPASARAHQGTSAPIGAEEAAFECRLAFDEADIAMATKADAVLIRGLPEGASLSSGIADPSVRGWIVKPIDLATLVVRGIRPSMLTAEIALAAIYLDGRGQPHIDVIATRSLEPITTG